LSWYGHSERAILAWEKREPFVYEPFQTYGYCEAVEDKQTGRWRLIGTSYFNHASPFIRYDTGDDIEPVEFESGVLRSFRIREGRVGDFVVDRHGVRIPLTALVFGRHHELFNLAKFLQVRQEERGRITVLVTPKNGLPEGFDFTKWFDASGLAMDIAFQVLESPILTPAGKVALKVSSLQGTADSPQVRGDVYETSVLFNAKARTWNQKYQPGGALASRVNAFSEHLVRSLAPNDKILDLGCGTGAIAVELVARGFRIAACDVAEQMIEVGKQIYSECPIEWFLLPSDWKRLPFESNTFGGIVASSVLEYVSDVNMVLAECQRALKPGGLLLATVPDSHKLIRRLENFLRPAAILAVRMSILDRIPILLSYTTYLKCSRNRMPLDEWFAIGKQAGFEVVEEIRSRASKTALIFLVFRKTDSNS
jgi:ubiquinone/menaquinone biosynthesis C-methylase UbiE